MGGGPFQLGCKMSRVPSSEVVYARGLIRSVRRRKVEGVVPLPSYEW